MKKIRYAGIFISFIIWILLVLFYAAEDEILGSSIKILFVHVPSAWIAVLCYLLSLYYSMKYLLKKEISFTKLAYFCSLVGTILIIAATVSGAIWAKIAWNSFWNGDVRQTTIVLLLLIYASYFAIYHSFENKSEAGKLASIYQIIAALSVPILIFILPRVYSTLHPTVVSINKKPQIEINTIIVLIYSLVIFSWGFIELLISKINRLKNEFEK